MNILLAFDGSVYSSMAAKILVALKLSVNADITLMTVIPEQTFLGGITLPMFKGGDKAKRQTRKSQEEGAIQLLQGTVDILKNGGARVNTLVFWGSPAEQIVNQAHKRRADLVAIGAKGAGDSSQFPLGSVAPKVMKYANTSVLIAREAPVAIRRVLLATDGSKYSDTAARFLLNIPLSKKIQVILVSSLESHVAAMLRMPTLNMETNRKIISELRSAEEQAARTLMHNTKTQFQEKGYHVESLVLRGEAAEEIMTATKTLNPDLVVLGAKGLSGIETFFLGSVAQRVARFSRYSVLIVRPSGQ